MQSNVQKQKRVRTKIGNLLFHRMGIVAVLIIAQIILYGMGLLVLRDSAYYNLVESWAARAIPATRSAG